MTKTANRARLLAALALALWASPARAVPLDGLLVYLPFSGNANDASGNGNDGTVFGASLAPDRFGNPDSAFAFDGTGDYIRIVDSAPSLSVSTALTLSAWVDLASFGAGFEHIVNKTNLDGTDVGYRLAAWQANPTGNSLELFDTTGAQQILDDGLLPAVGSWMHVAATWDGATMSIYRNGVLQGSAPFAGSLSVASNDVFIGVNPVFGGQGYLHGLIDEVTIYDRALSADEIRALAAPEPSLVLVVLTGLTVLVGRRERTRR